MRQKFMQLKKSFQIFEKIPPYPIIFFKDQRSWFKIIKKKLMADHKQL